MYWFMTADPIGLAALVAVTLGYGFGGWLAARHAFRLEPRERMLAGLGVGLCLYVWSTNVVAQVLEPTAAFVGGAVVALAIGLVAAARSGQPLLSKDDLASWPLLAWILAGAVLFTLMGRGLSILDDRKNLSLISLMAAGDVPPHYYMNPDWLFRYHYGFQLFAASLVRLGRFFPWSAFDLSKGFVAALSLGAGYLVGLRLTHRREGGWLAVALLLLASGARWLLLLVPPAGLRALSGQLTLWGSAETTAASLDRALTSTWVISGGPPVPIPFAFVNGILEPFTLGLQAGPGSLSRLILLLFVLLASRTAERRSLVPLTILFSAWALASEATYGLVLVGLFASAAIVLVGQARRAPSLGVLLAAGGLSVAISLIQGGTLTEIARGVLLPATRDGGGAAALFSLRWPPAIVSSHLGELSLASIGSLLVAVAEIGPILFIGPWAVVRSSRWLRQGRLHLAILGFSTAAGFAIPLLVRYHADRDISRFTAHAALGWILLSLGLVATAWRRKRGRSLIAASVLVVCLGGLVTLANLLTAIPRGVISEKISPLDASMARQLWDRLEPGATIMDSDAWRSVAITGRWTRSTGEGDEPLPEWEALVASPDPAAIAAAGYAYVYLDTYWWNSMEAAARASFADACVVTVAEGVDDAANGTRRLLDVRACAPPG